VSVSIDRTLQLVNIIITTILEAVKLELSVSREVCGLKVDEHELQSTIFRLREK
jgi:hypothetical protein